MNFAKAVPFLVLLLTLSGCSNSEEASSIPSWPAPDAYEFTLDSSCGERALIGEFRVVVEGGSVVEVEGLDESARAMLENRSSDAVPDAVPTLSELLDQAADASEQGADAVEVQSNDDGRPTEIDIDWDTNAIDDEACYEITDYSAAS